MNKNKLIKEFLELNRDNKVSDCTEDLNVLLNKMEKEQMELDKWFKAFHNRIANSRRAINNYVFPKLIKKNEA